jgi:hypothetical protein
MGWNDVETGILGDMNDGPFSEKAIRLAFVRKVYSILTLQLVVTFIPVLALTIYRSNPENDEQMIQYMAQNSGGVIAALIISIVFMITLSIMLSCCENVRRTHPWNMICLGLYTLATTVLVTFITIAYSTDAVGYAMGFTVVITLGLTIFAIQTKIDFTVLYQLGFALLLILLLFGFSLAITGTHNGVASRVYAALGTLIFALFIVIDTQLIMGKGRYQISPEEYVMGALIIYMDVINLFIFLLRLIGGGRN